MWAAAIKTTKARLGKNKMELREDQIKQVAAELGLKPHQVNATVSLLD